jgi:hypothetical protein
LRAEKEKDEGRRWLKVLRISNKQVFEGPEAVVERIVRFGRREVP